jgi:tetratricopeptide (TPR) repeat protein
MKQYGVSEIPLEAQYFYRRALEIKNDGHGIKNNGKEEEALKYLKLAVSIAPRFCNAYNAMGNCLDEMGRYEEAKRKYDKVLELNPQHTEARFKRAMVQKKIRCYEYVPLCAGLSALLCGT